MADKKLTDEDVVEGLERCISTTTDKACAGCPFNKQNLCNIDQWALEKYALDLIKRQQEENEKLQKNQDDIDNFARDICKERLLKGKAIANFDDLQEYIRKEKSKAVKEFAEALKKRYDNPVWYLGGSNGFFDNLDSFVKEMVGEEE